MTDHRDSVIATVECAGKMQDITGDWGHAIEFSYKIQDLEAVQKVRLFVTQECAQRFNYGDIITIHITK